MQTRHHYLLPTLVFAAPVALLFACSEPGPAERAGQKLDETVENVRDAIDPAGPAEKAGRKVDEAVDRLTERDE